MGKMIEATSENIEHIGVGAKVKLNPAYGSGAKYFVCHLSDGFCLIADCKKDLRDGLGYIHSIWNINAYEAFE